MRLRSLLLAVAVAAFVSACGERAEPLARDLTPYPVTVRGGGEQPITIRSAPERIVVLDPGSAELLVALGAADRLVGVPAGLVPPSFYTETVPQATPVVPPSGRIDVDAVTRLDPDLVVATAATDPVDVGLVARETGAALYLQPGQSVEDVERAALELGLLVGEPVRARRLVAGLRREIRDVESRVAERMPVRVFVDTGFLITVPERSLVGDLVRRAGGISVAGSEPPSGPFKPCRVARLRPEVLLRLLEAEGPRRPPSFRGCRGGGRRAPRQVELRADLVNRPGPRVGEALSRIARALHPDAF